MGNYYMNQFVPLEGMKKKAETKAVCTESKTIKVENQFNYPCVFTHSHHGAVRTAGVNQRGCTRGHVPTATEGILTAPSFRTRGDTRRCRFAIGGFVLLRDRAEFVRGLGRVGGRGWGAGGWGSPPLRLSRGARRLSGGGYLGAEREQ